MHCKKLIAPALVAVLMTALTACGGSNTPTDVIYDDVETEQVEKTVKTYTSMFESDLDQFRVPESGDMVVTLETNYGDIDILMFPEAAPKAVKNFIDHANDDYYDGVTFHRVIYDFMIQGGDPEGTGRGGESVWGQPFEDEFDDEYFPYRGALAMANSGEDTNGSQFFIVQSFMNEDKAGEAEAWAEAMTEYQFDQEMIEAYKTLGGTPFLYNKHTVFGQVVSGMDVVDTIASVKTDSNDKPDEDVVIEDVYLTVIE